MSASAVLGFAAGILGWLACGSWLGVAPVLASYGRLDQVTGWILGAVVGGVVLGSYQRRVEGRWLLSGFSGMAVGGGVALCAATATAILSHPVTNRGFLGTRMLGFAFCSTIVALSLGAQIRRCTTGLLIRLGARSFFSGLAAGLLFSLPGTPELWQGIAFALFGAGIGAAFGLASIEGVGAVAERLPRRGLVPGILTLREVPLHPGDRLHLGDAELVYEAGELTLIPPPAGAVFNGRALVSISALPGSGTLLVAGERFQVRVRSGR